MSDLLDKPFASVPGLRSKDTPSGPMVRARIIWQSYDAEVGASHPVAPIAPSGQRWAVRCTSQGKGELVQLRALWDMKERVWGVPDGFKVVDFIDPGHLGMEDGGGDDDGGD